MLAAGWRWIFLANLPIAAAVLLLGARALPTPQRRQDPSGAFDLAGITVTFALLTSFVLGITRLADPYFKFALWPWCLAAAALLLAVLVRIERRASRPAIPLTLLGKRQLATVYVLATGAGCGMGAIVFLTSIAESAYAVPARDVGFVLLPLVIFSMLGSVGAGRLLNRVGARGLILIGFALLAVGYAATADTAYGVWGFFAASIPVGIGIGVVAGGSLRSLAIDEAPPEVRGSAQGLINICTAIGTLVSVAAIGSLADFGGGGTAGFALAYVAVAAFMVLMLTTALGLRATRVAPQPIELG
jgi:predicted MFS family arabinose efflux permease